MIYFNSMLIKELYLSIRKKFELYPRRIFLLLTIVVGIFILYPTNNVELFLSQGDHGRDLYAFKKTAEGALPYKDYFWNYGPLMPFYYAFFIKVFNPGIQSVLLGQNVLNFISGILVYLTMNKTIKNRATIPPM